MKFRKFYFFGLFLLVSLIPCHTADVIKNRGHLIKKIPNPNLSCDPLKLNNCPKTAKCEADELTGNFFCHCPEGEVTMKFIYSIEGETRKVIRCSKIVEENQTEKRFSALDEKTKTDDNNNYNFKQEKNMDRFSRPCLLEKGRFIDCPLYEECDKINGMCRCQLDLIRDPSDGGKCVRKELNSLNEKLAVDFDESGTYDRDCLLGVDYEGESTICPLDESCQATVDKETVDKKNDETKEDEEEEEETVDEKTDLSSRNGLCKCSHSEWHRDVSKGGLCMPPASHKSVTVSPGTQSQLLSHHPATHSEILTKSTTTTTTTSKSWLTTTIEEPPRLNIDITGPNNVFLPLSSFIVIKVNVTLVNSRLEKSPLLSSASCNLTQTSGPETLVVISSLQENGQFMSWSIHQIHRPGLFVWIASCKSPKYGQIKKPFQFTVKRVDNKAPTAKAGTNQILQLPNVFLKLDGRNSIDDVAIVKYHWTKLQESPAAGQVINQSDHQAILYMTDLVAGIYKFQLNVEDEEGMSGEDSVTVIILSAPNKTVSSEVELILVGKLSELTEGDKNNIVEAMELLLEKDFNDKYSKIKVDRISEDSLTGFILLLFHVDLLKNEKVKNGENSEAEENIVGSISANQTVETLRKYLTDKPTIYGLKVFLLHPMICENSCSGRGKCHSRTDKCICQSGYTSNWFKREENCDWNKDAVAGLTLLSVLFIILLILFIIRIRQYICCCCYKGRSSRKKPLHYSLLNDLDLIELDTKARNATNEFKKNSYKSKVSDLSSDDENVMFARPTPNHA